MREFVQITAGSQLGVLIAPCPKSGFTSITETLRRAGAGKTVPWHVGQSQACRLYLRHPIRRFISAWRNFTVIGKFPALPESLLLDVNEFADHVLAGAQDDHWRPQLELFAGANIQEIHRFEDILETWPIEYPLLHQNRSLDTTSVPSIAPKQMDGLNAYYADDLVAWDVR